MNMQMKCVSVFLEGRANASVGGSQVQNVECGIHNKTHSPVNECILNEYSNRYSTFQWRKSHAKRHTATTSQCGPFAFALYRQVYVPVC